MAVLRESGIVRILPTTTWKRGSTLSRAQALSPFCSDKQLTVVFRLDNAADKLLPRRFPTTDPRGSAQIAAAAENVDHLGHRGHVPSKGGRHLFARLLPRCTGAIHRRRFALGAAGRTRSRQPLRRRVPLRVRLIVPIDLVAFSHHLL